MEKKINLFFLYCESRNGGFGMNAHATSLLDNFSKHEAFNLFVIKTDCQEVDEVTEVTEEHITYLKIPSPGSNLMLYTHQDHIQLKYAERLTDVILSYYAHVPNQVFLVNSIDFLNVIRNVKLRLADSKILNIHHAWSWKYFFNTSDELFTDKWARQISEHIYTDRAFEYSRYQIELANLSNKTVVVTKQAKDFFSKTFKVADSKLSLIYNGIDENGLAGFYAQTKEKAKESLGFQQTDKVILYSGRLVAEKGIFYLLEAFAEVLQAHPACKLLLVGSGEYDKIVKKASPFFSKIFFKGNIPREEVFTLYRAADICILPSLAEQCSFFALETIFFKVPLIVTDLDGLGELFTHQENCLKMPVRLNKNQIRSIEPTTIAQQINRLLADEELSNRLTNNAYAMAQRKFKASEMIDKYNRLILEEI